MENKKDTPSDSELRQRAGTLGLRLVQMLVKQLDGSIELYLEKGTRYVIQFKPATA